MSDMRILMVEMLFVSSPGGTDEGFTEVFWGVFEFSWGLFVSGGFISWK
jgi:hypothetical protein